jgi:hypothetical protein
MKREDISQEPETSTKSARALALVEHVGSRFHPKKEDAVLTNALLLT